MPTDDNNTPENPTQAFIQHLEGTGFFEQISNLETSLKSIVGEIEGFNVTSNQRQEESENIAAHILAMEAVLAAVLKKLPIEEDDVILEAQRQATALTGKPATNPTVEAIARNLVQKANSGGED